MLASILLAGAVFTLPSPAFVEPVDRYAAVAIEGRRLEPAIERLSDRVRVRPDDESALINLAVAYRKLGRTAEANVLYARVLDLPDVLLDRADGGTIMSRDVARRALARTELAAR